MGLQLSTRQIGYALLGFTLLAVGLTAYMALTAHHPMAPIDYAPAAALVAVMVAWPFANGWRPFTPASRRLHSCPACGTEWLPSEAGGTHACPACGA
jgi:hypothetical protein